MSASIVKLVFLIASGLRLVKSNLFSNDQEMAEAMMMETHRTTRPPHKIFFYENADNTVERIVDDDLGFHPDVHMGNGGFAERGVGPLSSNSTGILDPTPINNFFPQTTEDMKSFPSIILTPQQFLHIKVSIPRAFYTTRVYPDLSDVDILEIISRPNSIPASRQLPDNSGRGPSGSGLPIQRTTNGFPAGIVNPASPYLGSSMLSPINPGLRNSQNSGPNNVNWQPDYEGNSQYNTQRGIGNPVYGNQQNGQPFAQSSQLAQNGVQFAQGKPSFGQPSNQMSQYPNPNQSGGINNYDTGFPKTANSVKQGSLFSSLRPRTGLTGVPTTFPNMDPSFKIPQSPHPQSVPNAVRSLDDGTESSS